MFRIIRRVRRGVVVSAVGALTLGGLVALNAAPVQAFDSSCIPANVELKTLKISPTKVNVKTGKRTVKVSGTTSGPPLTMVLAAAAPVGKGNALVGSAAPKGNRFTIKIVVPKGASKGKHNLSLGLNSAEQAVWLETKDLVANKFPHSFNAISRPDRKAPKLTSITLSRKSVNTTKKAAKFTITAKATDKGGSGLQFAHVHIGNKSASVHAVMEWKKGKFTGTVKFPKFAGTKKKAIVLEAGVGDMANNWTYYGKGEGEKKLTRKLSPSLKVKSKKDTKAPVVLSASATPNPVKVGQRRWELNYAVKASDSQSGVAEVSVALRQQGSSDDFASNSAWLVKKKGVWRGASTVQCDQTPGTYDVVVTATDNVGRETVTTKGTVTFTE